MRAFLSAWNKATAIQTGLSPQPFCFPCSSAASVLPELLSQRRLHGEQHVSVQAVVQRGWAHVHRWAPSPAPSLLPESRLSPLARALACGYRLAWPVGYQIYQLPPCSKRNKFRIYTDHVFFWSKWLGSPALTEQEDDEAVRFSQVLETAGFSAVFLLHRCRNRLSSWATRLRSSEVTLGRAGKAESLGGWCHVSQIDDILTRISEPQRTGFTQVRGCHRKQTVFYPENMVAFFVCLQNPEVICPLEEHAP